MAGLSSGPAVPQSSEPDLPEPPEMEEKEKKKAQKWVARLKVAEKVRKPLIEAGDKVFRYVTGQDETFRNIAKSSLDFDIKVIVPLIKGLVDSIAPVVMHRDPKVSIIPRNAEDEILVRVSQISTELLEKANREHDFKAHARMAVKESLIYPFSVIETDFSDERKIPRPQWQSMKKVMWDPTANGLPSSMRWAAIEYELPISVARKEFDAPWLRADSSSIKSGESEKEKEEFFKSFSSIDSTSFLDQKKLIRIWFRGDVQNVDDVTQKGKDAESDTGEDEFAGLPGENRLIILDPVGMRILRDDPWPFVLDTDALPVHFLVPELFPGRMATIGTFEPLAHTQDILNWLYTLISNGVMHGSQMKAAYDPEIIQEKEINQLKVPQHMNMIPIQELSNLNFGKALQEIKFEGVTDTALQGLNIFQSLFSQISQQSDFSAGAVAGIEKTGVAQIADARVQNRIALFADQIEDWMQKILKSEFQIALSLMDGDAVEKWVGEGRLGGEDFVQEEDGSIRVRLLQFWPEDLTPEQIRTEADLMIEPGSVRKVSKEEQVNNLLLLYDRAIGAIGNLQERLAPVGQRITPDAELRMYNHVMNKIFELQNDTNTQPFLITEADIENVAPPEPEAPAAPEAGLGGGGLPSETDILLQQLGL